MDNYDQYGFKYSGSCNCDGSHTEKYNKGDYKIKVRTKSQRFKITKHGVTIHHWDNIINIISTIEKLNVAVQA